MIGMTGAASRTNPELPILIDRTADATLPDQVASQLREIIDRRVLRAGEPLPATRGLAERLGVARGVVVAAYEQLSAEGYVVSGHGTGTRVHPDLRAAPSVPRRSRVPRQKPDLTPAASRPAPTAQPRPLSPGVPDTSAIESPAWRAAWRSASVRAHLDVPDLGDARLRSAIAEHLRRMRGTVRDPNSVLVTSGARDGLGLLLSALGTTHGRRLVVGVEDPGYPSLRRVAARHGADIVALPADADGLATAELPAHLLDLVIVTPSHQYPLGGSLPLARRHELLAWAKRSGAIIVEDDFDSELRYTGSPLPTLAALDDPDTGSVVLLGTFSKTISHALSAGYLLAPKGLREIIEPVRHDLGGPLPAVVQAALAAYLDSGELRRHTARMRRRYAARRQLVIDELSDVHGVNVRPMSGGLHAVLEIERMRPGSPSGVLDALGRALEERLLARAGELGAVPLSGYWQERRAVSERFGLVIGMGGVPDRAARRGQEELAAALRQLKRILEEELRSNGAVAGESGASESDART